MSARHFSLIAATLALLALPGAAQADSQPQAALAGTVSSAKEGLMEGVVVSAKQVGSTVTVSVATDDKGRFSFPASRLKPGQYAISIRAIGYDLEDPKSADVAAGQTATIDIKLAPTKNLPKQMSNAEWFVSFPGTDQEKKALLNCVSCHNLDRIVRSQYDGEQFVEIFNRMVGYYPGSTPEHPQRLVGEARRSLGQGPNMRTVAEYLASINLSKESWTYPLKTLPRLTGRSSRVIVTEYSLPRRLIQPHDVVVDEQGMVWFTHFAEQFFGKMDPKTGQVWEYPLPLLKPGYPVGTLDLGVDKAGNLWIGMMYQGGIARFDKKTETFKTWSIPKEWQTDAAQSGHLDPSSTHVDGKVWVKNSDGSQILRLDPQTGQWENLGSFSDRTASGSASTASAPTATTTSICSTSSHRPSAASTPRPSSSRPIAARSPTRGRAAARSMTRTGCGMPSTPAMPSACSIPRPRPSRNGWCRRRGRNPTTSSPTRTARPGPAR